MRPVSPATQYARGTTFSTSWRASFAFVISRPSYHRLMVQMDKVAKLRAEWIAKGDPPCDHPRVDKEHYLGTGTGDEACLICGRSWPRGQRPAPGTQES